MDHPNPLEDGTSYHTVLACGHMVHVNANNLVVLELSDEGAFYALTWKEMLPLMAEAYKRHQEKAAAVADAIFRGSRP